MALQFNKRRYMHGKRRHPSHRIGWEGTDHSSHTEEEEIDHMTIIRNGKNKKK